MKASGKTGNPKVSVVIPCYNQADYLPDAVGSVTGQTYRDFEIIIVNDGSTDDTREVAEGLIGKYPGQAITLINQENQGLPTARNNGMEIAKGEYILPLDADDMIEPAYLFETARALEENPGVSVAYTSARVFGDEDVLLQYGEYDFESFLTMNRMPVCSLFRKKAWEDVGGYKREMSRGYEDWEFWITLGEAGHAGKLVGGPLFLYRKHGPSMMDRSARIHAEIFAEIRRLHPRFYTAERLEKIIDLKCRELVGCQETCREQQEYIDEVHTLKGFFRRACMALLRRAGLAG